MNAADFKFSYENADDFQTFPTIPVIMSKGILKLKIPGVPKFKMMMLLHGEEKVEFLSPIPVDSTVLVS